MIALEHPQKGYEAEERGYASEEEKEFQKYVTGNRMSMVEVWKAIGRSAKIPRELSASDRGAQGTDLIQIYIDKGDGFSEDDSFFPEETYDEHQTVKLDVEVTSKARCVRVDPAFNRCIVTFKNILWNDISIESDDIDVTISHNGKWASNDTIIFDTMDPNIEFGLPEDMSGDKNHLKVKMVMTMIPEEIAHSMVEAIVEKEEEQVVPEKVSVKDKVRNKLKNGIKSINVKLPKKSSDPDYDYDEDEEDRLQKKIDEETDLEDLDE